MQHETLLADLGGMGVVVVDFTVDDTTITVSPTWKDRMANTPSPLASVLLEFESAIHRRLLSSMA